MAKFQKQSTDIIDVKYVNGGIILMKVEDYILKEYNGKYNLKILGTKLSLDTKEELGKIRIDMTNYPTFWGEEDNHYDSLFSILTSLEEYGLKIPEQDITMDKWLKWLGDTLTGKAFYTIANISKKGRYITNTLKTFKTTNGFIPIFHSPKAKVTSVKSEEWNNETIYTQAVIDGIERYFSLDSIKLEESNKSIANNSADLDLAADNTDTAFGL